MRVPRNESYSKPSPHHVVIVGGGFGGLKAARRLRRAPLRVTLLDRRNFHLFQPLLYQVATGALSPANIAAPLRALFKRHTNIEVLLDEVLDVDVSVRELILREGRLKYDTLILAAGSRHHYFGKSDWEPFAPGLKSIEDATEIRRRVLLAFENAEREDDIQKRQACLRFVIVGAGATGVELAGALSEIAHHTLRDNFRRIDPRSTEIILIDSEDRVLSSFPPDLSEMAVQALKRMGVTVRLKSRVQNINSFGLVIQTGEKDEFISSHTILWAAGVRASPLAGTIAKATGAKIDKAGRIAVQPDLSIAGHPEIIVIGDMALFTHQTGKPLPGIAPVAMQQGRYAAELILARTRGKTPPPFHYIDRGTMATIGRSAAVVALGRWRYNGMLAWLTWLFVHLTFLVQFENKFLVLCQWAWNYFTRNRSARLITDPAEAAGSAEKHTI